MSYGGIILLLLIAGLFATFKLSGAARRKLRWAWLSSVLLAGGGCVAALSWLGAETSGRDNLFHAVNPFVWTAIFGIGVLSLIITAIRAMLLVREEQADEESGASD